MTITTTTEVTELVLAKAVDTLVAWYQFDEVVGLPFGRFKSLAGTSTGVASFPRYVKDAHEDIANQTTALTPQAIETTAVDVTCARIGIAREFSSETLEDTVLGRAMFMSEMIADAAILLGEAADQDFLGLFTSASNSAGTAGSALTVAMCVSAFGTQRGAKVRGEQVMILDDEQLEDLQLAQAAATATPWASFYAPNADGSNFGGYFMGSPVFASSLIPTQNTGANSVGCVFAQGQSAPRYAAFGYAVKRAPTTKYDEDILYDTEKTATIARYGVGAICTNFATKVVSLAT